ncbi:helix-turn-helix transcriptional regulator [Dactylosporangium sp. CS-047395]|uniref:helix-turn-helix transcriptional regulator n=1 Tax=Dactylosporangium sp. CS-047395 TaxID=3239936 RepID=UPI003D89F24C
MQPLSVPARLAALSAPARRILQVASVLGPCFGVLDLARLMRCATAQLLPYLDEILAAGLLVNVEDRATFPDELVHAAVAETLCKPAAAALRAEAAALPRSGAGTGVGVGAGVGAGPAPVTGWESLTEQERRIAELVGRALTNQQIAHRIGRTRHTVNYHLRRTFRKLGISSRVELAALARAHR